MGILEAVNWALVMLNAIGLLLSIPPPEHPELTPQQQEIKYDSSSHESVPIPDAP